MELDSTTTKQASKPDSLKSTPRKITLSSLIATELNKTPIETTTELNKTPIETTTELNKTPIETTTETTETTNTETDTLQTGLNAILDRLNIVCAIIIPLLYWMAVTLVLATSLCTKLIRYTWPLIQEHVTAQMGWEYCPQDYASLSNTKTNLN